MFARIEHIDFAAAYIGRELNLGLPRDWFAHSAADECEG